MSDSNALTETIPTVHGWTDDTIVSKLHDLIEASPGKRKWPQEAAKAAEEMMAAVLLAPASTRAELGQMLALAQDLPIVIIEELFDRYWQTLSGDRREELVSELLTLTSDKSQARKAAIAEKIARTDRRSAAVILQGLISSGKKSKDQDFWPQLSKEKKELLRGRFGNRAWIDFDEPEESLMRILLAGFFEAMTEPESGKGAKSQRPAYDFARWVLSTVKRIRIDASDRQLMTNKVLEMGKDFPDQWRVELSALSREISSEVPHRLFSPSINREVAPGLVEDTPKVEEIRSPAEPVAPVALPEGSNSEVPVSHSPNQSAVLERTFHSAVDELVKRKRTELTIRNSSIELLQNDVHSVESEVQLIRELLKAFENSQMAKNDLESELRQIRLKADGLQAAISLLEPELALTRKAQTTAEDRSCSLSKEKEEVQRALDEEKRSRAHDRRELEYEIERTASVRLEGFKAQLSRSLRPVFVNKRTTDDQEPSARLSEFLRSWLAQLEAHLVQAGVDISKDG